MSTVEHTIPDLNQELVAQILPLLEENRIDDVIDVYMGPPTTSFDIPINYDGDTVFTWAILHQNIELARALLESGANINTPRVNNLDLTPLILATNRNLPDIVRFLLDNGADIDTLDYNDETALHDAIINEFTDIVDLLLDAGADPNLTNHEGETPLYMAIEANNVAIVRALLEHDADPNEETLNGNTLLHMAIDLPSLDIVRVLLDNGADPELENQNNETALEIAQKMRNEAMDDQDNELVDTMDKIIELLKNASSESGTHIGSSSDISALSSIRDERDSDVSLPDFVLPRNRNRFAQLNERGSNESSSIDSPPSLPRSGGGGTRRKKRVKAKRAKTRRVYRKKTVGKRMRSKKNKTKRKRGSKK